MSEGVRPFQVRRIAFECEDCPGTYKERPVIVGAVSGSRALVMLVKVTGHGPRPEFPGEVRIQDWQQASLSQPSTARCSKTVQIDLEDVRDASLLGELSEFDRQAIREGLFAAGKIVSP